MKKLKNVGAGPVHVQKEVIDNCPEFSKRSKQSSVHSNFNGITLIALIITVIVMLILVGVTINVAINGGLFESTTTAATETKKEAEKEQLLPAVVGAIGTDGKVDSTKISLPEGFQKDDSKSTETKLVVKGKEGIYWEIDLSSAAIKEYSESSTGATTYTFTIGDLAERGLLEENFYNEDMGFVWTKEEFFPEDISEELKQSTLTINLEGDEFLTYNIKSSYKNMLIEGDGSEEPNGYYILLNGDDIAFLAINENSERITKQNYENYKDVSFTISMAE